MKYTASALIEVWLDALATIRLHDVTGPVNSPIPAGIASTPSHSVPCTPSIPKSGVTPRTGKLQVCSTPSASQ